MNTFELVEVSEIREEVKCEPVPVTYVGGSIGFIVTE